MLQSPPTAATATAAEEGIWYADRLTGDSPEFNVPVGIRIRGPLDVPALTAALDAVVARHEALRTSFPADDQGRPGRAVAARATLPLTRRDATGADPAAVDRLIADFAWKPIPVTDAPPARAQLLRLAGDDHVLVVNVHHIVFDDWSIGLFFRDLDTFYAAARTGRDPSGALPPAPPIPPDEPVGDRERHAAYWRDRLAGAEPLRLSADRPRPPVRSGRGDACWFEVPGPLAARIRGLAAERRATVFMVLGAAYQALLARWSGQPDVTVGVPLAGRERPELENVVGYFVRTVALRCPVQAGDSFGDLLSRFRTRLFEAHEHRNLPFEQIVEAAGQPRDAGRTPLFQAAMAFQNALGDPPALDGLTVSPCRIPRRAARFDILLDMADQDGRMWGLVEYSTDLFTAGTVDRFIADYLAVLDAAVTDPESALAAASLPYGPPSPATGDAAGPPVPATGDTHVPPRTPVEHRLAAIWAEVLDIDDIGVHDDFFDLGGHSLLVARVLTRVRDTLGVTLPMRTLLTDPTIAKLAAVIDTPGGPAAGTPAAAGAAARYPAPLSPGQQRLWYLHHLDPASTAYTCPFGLSLDGDLDTAALRRAVEAMVNRHEILRVRIVAGDDGSPVQLLDGAAAVSLVERDVRDGDPAAATRAWLETPFDLGTGPLARFLLLRTGASRHLLLVNVHHVIFDDLSAGVLLDELGPLYRAARDGHDTAGVLPALPVQYADVVTRVPAGVERQRSYWRDRLAGLPRLALPAGRNRPAGTGHGDVVPLTVPAPVAHALHRLSRAHGATLFMTLLAAFQAVLARHAGHLDVPVGVLVPGRTERDTEGLVGFFLNTLIVRSQLTAGATFAETLQHVRERVLEAYDHADVPFDEVVRDLGQDRRGGTQSPVQVMFDLRQHAPVPPALPGLEVGPLTLPHRTAIFDLTVDLAPDGDGMTGTVEYRTDLFDRETVRRLADDYERLLAEVAGEPDRPLPAGPPVTAQPWGAAVTAPFRPVADLILEQARRTPGAVAITDGVTTLTYAELAARSAEVAAGLRARGVGPESVVALAAPRRPATVVAMLGVLRAGGVCLPLDPALPQARRDLILRDARPAVVLTGPALPAAGTGEARPCVPVTADQAAYLIYTSGSTGVPKGVVGLHGALSRHCAAMRDGYRITAADRVLQFAPFSFDASLEQLLPALTAGAAVVLRGDDLPRPDQVPGFLDRHRVTVAEFTPAYWSAVVEHLNGPGSMPDGLRLLVLGGDAAPAGLLGRWRAAAPGCRVVNTYGPTETTITATAYDVPDDPGAATLPIGGPLPGTRLHVYGPDDRPVPPGSTGELMVGGAGVTRGYLGRPGLTADRFRPDPYARGGARLYRTGDLVRLRPDRALEFRGRTDDQVQVRGVRVEPGEVRAVLLDHPAVADAAVTTRPGRADDGLVAWLQPAAGHTPDTAEVRGFCAARLPAVMVPVAVHLVTALPTTAHGKVDLTALPAEPAPRTVAAPATATERVVAHVWAAVLGQPPPDPDAEFFASGGHSLAATRIVARINAALQIDVSLGDLLAEPTVRRFSRVVDSALADDAPVTTMKEGPHVQ